MIGLSLNSVIKVVFMPKRSKGQRHEYLINTDNYKTAEEIASKRLFFDGHSKSDFKEVVMAQVQVFDK